MENAAALADTAVEAARAQHTALPGEALAAAMVARFAKGVLALNERSPNSRRPSRSGSTSTETQR